MKISTTNVAGNVNGRTMSYALWFSFCKCEVKANIIHAINKKLAVEGLQRHFFQYRSTFYSFLWELEMPDSMVIIMAFHVISLAVETALPCHRSATCHQYFHWYGSSLWFSPLSSPQLPHHRNRRHEKFSFQNCTSWKNSYVLKTKTTN